MGKEKTRSGPLLGYTMHVLGLLSLGILLTFGLMYWQGGVVIAALYSLLIIVILTVLVHILLHLKTTDKFQKRNQGVEKFIILPLYIFLSLGTLIPAVHFLNVELNLKAHIKSNVTEQLDLLNDNLDNYNKWIDRKKSDYEIDRSTALANNEIVVAEKDAEVNAFNAKMNMEFNAVSPQIRDFILSTTRYFDGWNFERLITVQSHVNNRVNEFNKKMREGSADHPFTKKSPFIPETQIMETIELNNAMKSLKSDKLFLAIPIFLLCHFLILLPYLFSARAGSHFVKSQTGSGGVIVRRKKQN